MFNTFLFSITDFFIFHFVVASYLDKNVTVIRDDTDDDDDILNAGIAYSQQIHSVTLNGRRGFCTKATGTGPAIIELLDDSSDDGDEKSGNFFSLFGVFRVV